MNYGINLKREREEQDGTEYLAGKLPPCKAAGLDALSFDEMQTYFPKGEVQRSDKADMQDCASRDKMNLLETKYNWLHRNGKLTDRQVKFATENGYLTNNGFEFSDAFIAILSGTTKQGNSMKAPLQAVHKYGLVPKTLLPLEPWMTWEDYHNEKRITSHAKNLGKRWQEVMGEIFYEKEYDYTKEIGLVTSAYAWGPVQNGVYQNVEAEPNHAFYRPKPAHYVFDNYIDTSDGDFIKKLAPNYKLYPYGYKIVIGDPVKFSDNWVIDLWRRLCGVFTG